MFKKLKKQNIKNILKEKDPSDYKKSNSSTDWIGEDHYCKNCKCTTSHREFISSVCNSCGSFKTQDYYGRSYRKIFYQGKWQYQVKYKNGKEEIIENWYNNIGY